MRRIAGAGQRRSGRLGPSGRRPLIHGLAVLLLTGCGGEAADDAASTNAGTETPSAAVAAPSDIFSLWASGLPAFGVYVPDERPTDVTRSPEGRGQPALYTREGAAALAANPLYDYLFLNLEGSYDPDAVVTLSEGLRTPGSSARKTLLVRIPSISADGEEAARTRVAEILAAGADGVILPHVRTLEEARTAIGFFEEAGADVWSPSNPDGRIVAMLMVEDPAAVGAAKEIAALPGFSILACGIGSLTRALDGDRDAAESGNQAVLAAAKAAGLADMITANTEDVARRVDEGFNALLMSGPQADEAIRSGREAAGR